MGRVFLSHKDQDSEVAGRVAARLRDNGMEVYLDLIDPMLDKDGADLGEYLRDRMSECTQLIAVISRATQASWWVPWEIGVATEKNFFIATFVLQTIVLPEYLTKWPYLETAQDIDEYARTSKSIERQLATKSQFRSPTDALRSSSARDFHRVLKRSLGQFS